MQEVHEEEKVEIKKEEIEPVEESAATKNEKKKAKPKEDETPSMEIEEESTSASTSHENCDEGLSNLPELKTPNIEEDYEPPAKKVKHDVEARREPSEQNGPHESKRKEDKLPRVSRKFMHIETHPNGGASVLKANWKDIRAAFPDDEERHEFAHQFTRLGLSEINGIANFVISVIEDGASYLENIFSQLAEKYPNMPVKIGSLTNKQAVETMTMSANRKQVMETCHHGTFRCGPLNALSMIGPKQEECGALFQDILSQLARSHFLGPLMPWGPLSIVEGKSPDESDDGPFFWIRPGEQLIPTDEVKEEKGRKRGSVGQRSHMSLRTLERRELLFEDRTPCHADQVRDGIKRCTTAAVGVLQAVTGIKEKCRENRAVKDVVCFHASDYKEIVQRLRALLYGASDSTRPSNAIYEGR